MTYTALGNSPHRLLRYITQPSYLSTSDIVWQNLRLTFAYRGLMLTSGYTQEFCKYLNIYLTVSDWFESSVSHASSTSCLSRIVGQWLMPFERCRGHEPNGRNVYSAQYTNPNPILSHNQSPSARYPPKLRTAFKHLRTWSAILAPVDQHTPQPSLQCHIYSTTTTKASASETNETSGTAKLSESATVLNAPVKVCPTPKLEIYTPVLKYTLLKHH